MKELRSFVAENEIQLRLGSVASIQVSYEKENIWYTYKTVRRLGSTYWDGWKTFNDQAKIMTNKQMSLANDIICVFPLRIVSWGDGASWEWWCKKCWLFSGRNFTIFISCMNPHIILERFDSKDSNSVSSAEGTAEGLIAAGYVVVKDALREVLMK